MKQLFISCIVTLLLILSGCFNEESTEEPKIDNDETYESHEQPIAELEEVYTLGLYNKGDFEYERTFEIEHESFKRNIVLGNKTSKEGSFILLIFNHGEQMNFKVGDGKVSNNYRFDIKKEKYKDLEVTLLNLEDGFHSITYVLLNDPEEVPNDYETSMELADLFSIRVNLLKNIDNIPEERPNLFTEGIESEERRIHGAFLSKKEVPYETLYKEDMGEKEIPYTLFYGNSHSEKIDFYLVALLNYQQTQLGTDDFLYDTLETDQEKSISLDFNLPLKEESNSFQVLMIPTPFEPVSKEKTFLPQDPSASNRVLILK
ncbi:hypothetical protein CIL03_10050 [Virgibacillus indicus]|uniref:Intracellular proteinase inhibitor BsuPI domain-containing protein n=1 Tax=Virgibacillus indicus TaxID=2024554 RepID=A0A265NAZ1_9BACI|nr:hypothetical protein [Virgibacillus indicus]OZU88629.1 hypothetical protein CIL03_10050 [Virgibacillus indicus]